MIMAIEPRRIEMERIERWAAVVGGGILAFYGLARRDQAGVLLALMGGGIAMRGYRGQEPVHEGMELERIGRKGMPVDGHQALRFERTVSIERPVQEIYRAWRRLERLPELLEHLDHVLPLGGNRFRWAVRTALGTLDWDARLIEERANELLAWQSEPGSAVDSAGAMRFESTDGGGGTELQVALTYRPPEGPVGEMLVALLRGDPGRGSRARQRAARGSSPA
jgi:uncharacterized membrane protein